MRIFDKILDLIKVACFSIFVFPNYLKNLIYTLLLNHNVVALVAGTGMHSPELAMWLAGLSIYGGQVGRISVSLKSNWTPPGENKRRIHPDTDSELAASSTSWQI